MTPTGMRDAEVHDESVVFDLGVKCPVCKEHRVMMIDHDAKTFQCEADDIEGTRRTHPIPVRYHFIDGDDALVQVVPPEREGL